MKHSHNPLVYDPHLCGHELVKVECPWRSLPKSNVRSKRPSVAKVRRMLSTPIKLFGTVIHLGYVPFTKAFSDKVMNALRPRKVKMSNL